MDIDNDARVVHSLSDGGIAEMVLNTDKHEDSSCLLYTSRCV